MHFAWSSIEAHLQVPVSPRKASQVHTEGPISVATAPLISAAHGPQGLVFLGPGNAISTGPAWKAGMGRRRRGLGSEALGGLFRAGPPLGGTGEAAL